MGSAFSEESFRIGLRSHNSVFKKFVTPATQFANRAPDARGAAATVGTAVVAGGAVAEVGAPPDAAGVNGAAALWVQPELLARAAQVARAPAEQPVRRCSRMPPVTSPPTRRI